MQQILAIARLTFRAAYRFKLVLILSLVLLGGVVLLPLVLEGDGTAQGFAQIVITYTLSITAALLAISTLWLACGTLAGDVEYGTIQTITVKPVSRWRVWLGKWLGVMILNAVLLGLAGAFTFGAMKWRATKLPPEQRQVLDNEVLVSRASAKPPVPELDKAVDQLTKQRLEESSAADLNEELLRQQIRIQLEAQIQTVPPKYSRRWMIDLGAAADDVRDQPLFLRVKFQTSRSMMETLESIIYDTAWRVGPVDSPSTWRTNRSLTANAFHEIRIPAGMLDNEGKLRVEVGNPNDEALMFPLDNGIEVLYREASFGVNFIRGLLIIYFWIGLLAAVGLAAASFLSFPVAAFCSVTILILGMSTGLMSRVVSEGTVLGVNHETGEAGSSFIDWFAVPFFKAVLEVVGFAKGFSPIDALSTGTSIPWSEVGLAFFRLIMVMSGFAAALGMIIFTRRELATAQLSR